MACRCRRRPCRGRVESKAAENFERKGRKGGAKKRRKTTKIFCDICETSAPFGFKKNIKNDSYPRLLHKRCRPKWLEHHPPCRQPHTMISMPASATALPAKSHGVGRTPSTSHSQAIAVATYTPP